MLCPARDRCVFAEVGEEELARRACEVRYAKREAVFHEGDPAFGLYVIYRGKVKLFKHALDGRHQILQILGPADLLGEEALMDRVTYAASAQALTDAELLFIARDDLKALLRYTSVTQRLLERVLNRLNQTEELLLETRYSSAEERLRRLLRRLAREHGRPLDGHILIDLELTQTELGEMVGLTREAVSKHLGALKGEGLIAFHGRKLLVDPTTFGQARPPLRIRSHTGPGLTPLLDPDHPFS